jgi:hypothetical protein
MGSAGPFTKAPPTGSKRRRFTDYVDEAVRTQLHGYAIRLERHERSCSARGNIDRDEATVVQGQEGRGIERPRREDQ